MVRWVVNSLRLLLPPAFSTPECLLNPGMLNHSEIFPRKILHHIIVKRNCIAFCGETLSFCLQSTLDAGRGWFAGSRGRTCSRRFYGSGGRPSSRTPYSSVRTPFPRPVHMARPPGLEILPRLTPRFPGVPPEFVGDIGLVGAGLIT